MNVTPSGSGSRGCYVLQTKYPLCCEDWFIVVIISFSFGGHAVTCGFRQTRISVFDARFQMSHTLLGILQPGRNHTVVTTALQFLRASPSPDSSPYHSLWSLQMLFREESRPSPPRVHSAVLLVIRQSSWPKTRGSPTSYRPTSRLEKTIGLHSAHLTSPLADSVWTPQVLGGIRIRIDRFYFVRFFTLFFDLDFSVLHSTFSPLAQDFPFDSRHDDTHPRRVRTRRRAPHGDLVKISYPWTLTLSHPTTCGLSPAVPLKSSSFTFPTYLHWRVEYLSCNDFCSAYKKPASGFVKGPGNCGPVFPSYFCVLFRLSDDLASLLSRGRLSDLCFLCPFSSSSSPSLLLSRAIARPRHRHPFCHRLSPLPLSSTIAAAIAYRPRPRLTLSTPQETHWLRRQYIGIPASPVFLFSRDLASSESRYLSSLQAPLSICLLSPLLFVSH